MKKSFLYILCAVVAMFSCTNSYETQQRIDKEHRRELQRQDSLALKIAVVPTLDCLPLYLAKERRMFDTLGVDVRLKAQKAQMDCDVALARGNVEGAVTDLVRSERIIKRGTPLTYVASTGIYWQLLSNHKARLKRLNQLGDKMIGMTRYSATDYLTDFYLKDVKTSAEVFRIQINDVQIRLRMLLNGEIDAVWLAEPLATVARNRNNPVLADSHDKLMTLGVVAFRTKGMADKHRKEQLRLFLKSYNMACDSLNARGFGHYTDVLKKYYAIDDATIKALPKTRFMHATPPYKQDIERVQAYVDGTLKPSY